MTWIWTYRWYEARALQRRGWDRPLWGVPDGDVPELEQVTLWEVCDVLGWLGDFAVLDTMAQLYDEFPALQAEDDERRHECPVSPLRSWRRRRRRLKDPRGEPP